MFKFEIKQLVFYVRRITQSYESCCGFCGGQGHIKGYIDYASDNFCNDCDYNEDEADGLEIVITWKHTIHKYNVSSEKYFKLFKDGEFSIKLNLDDYDASLWEK